MSFRRVNGRNGLENIQAEKKQSKGLKKNMEGGEKR